LKIVKIPGRRPRKGKFLGLTYQIPINEEWFGGHGGEREFNTRQPLVFSVTDRVR